MPDNRAQEDKVESAPENQSHTLDALFALGLLKNTQLVSTFQVSTWSQMFLLLFFKKNKVKWNQLLLYRKRYKILMDSSNKLDSNKM